MDPPKPYQGPYITYAPRTLKGSAKPTGMVYRVRCGYGMELLDPSSGRNMVVVRNIGALIIRMGFWGVPPYSNYSGPYIIAMAAALVNDGL